MAVQDETGWREAVLGAYSGVLDRVPDEKEIKYWMGVARSGVVGADLQNAFNNAAQAELAGRGNTVQDATNALAQNSTAGQQNQASNVVNTGATGALSAANTAADVGDINLGGDTDSAAGALANASLPAAQQQQGATSDPEAGWDEAILDAYDGILGRTPGQDEIKYWKGVARSGVTGNDLLNAFQNAAQTELKEREYEQLVLDQYANIGRTGIGDELSNVGQGEIKYWVDQLASGAITPDNLEPSFVNVIADFVSKNPDNEYSQYVSNYLQENDPRFQGVSKLFEETLGRKVDPAGLVYLYSQFGADVSTEERTAFLQGAAPERVQLLYRSVLGRDGSPEEIQAWVDAGVDPYRLEETFKEAAAPEVRRNSLPTVVSGIIEDNMVTAAEAFDLKKLANEFGFSLDDIVKLSGVDKSIVEQIIGKADTSIGDVIKTAQTAFASGDQAGVKNNTGYLINLLDTGVVSYKDLADQSGGVWTEQGVKDYVEPLRTFSSDFAAISDNPNLTSDEIRSFLNKYDKNQVRLFYGDETFNALQEAADDSYLFRSGKPVNPLSVNTISDQVRAINSATGGSNWSGSWMSGGDSAINHAAMLLAEKGVESLGDLSIKSREDGTGQDLVDKDSGAVISSNNSNDGKFSLDIYRTGNIFKRTTKYLGIQMVTDANGNSVAVPYTNEQSGGALGQVLAVAAIIPGPHQPFAQAANAIYALEQKNYIGAILSSLSAASSFGAQTSTQINALSQAGEIEAATNLSNTFGGTLAANLQGIRTASTIVAGLNAVDKENWAGVFSSASDLYKIYGDKSIGDALSGATGASAKDIDTGVKIANVGFAIQAGDGPGMLYALGELTRSADLKIAGASTRAIEAIKSGDPVRVVSAMQGLNKTVTQNADGSEIVKALSKSDDKVLADAVAGAVDGAGVTEGGVDNTKTAGFDVINQDDVTGVDDRVALITGAGGTEGGVDRAGGYDEAGLNVGTDQVVAGADTTDNVQANNFARLGADFAASKGKTVGTLTGDDLKEFENIVKPFIGNDVALKGASLQDLLTGNVTNTPSGWSWDPARGEYTFRVDISGIGSTGEEGEGKVVSGVDQNAIKGVGDVSKGYYDETTGDWTIEDNGKLLTGADLSQLAATNTVDWANTLEGERGEIVRQSLSTATGLVGDQLQQLGTALANMGFADRFNSMVEIGDILAEASGDLETPAVAQAKAQFIDAITKGDTYSDKIRNGYNAIIANPLALEYVAREFGQELLPYMAGGGVVKLVGLTGKALSGGKRAIEGILNGMESMGSSSKDAYEQAIREGKSAAEAETIANQQGWKAFGITTLLGGVGDSKLAGNLEKALGRVASKPVGSGVKEFTSEGLEELAIALATGDDLSTAITKSVVGSIVGSKTTASIDAGSVGDETIANIKNEIVQAYTDSGYTSTDGSYRADTIVPIETETAEVTTGGGSEVSGGTVNSDTVVDTSGSTAGDTDLVVDAGTDQDVTFDLGGTDTSQDAVSDTGGNTVSSVDEATGISTDVKTDTANNVVTTVESNPNTGVNTTTIVNGNANTETTTVVNNNANTETSTTVDNNNNIETTTVVDNNNNTETTVVTDANNNTETTVVTDSNVNTETTIVVDNNANTETTTVVDNNTNTETTTVVDNNNNTETTVTTDNNNNTETTVTTDNNTNTQTTVVVDTKTNTVVNEETKKIPLPDLSAGIMRSSVSGSGGLGMDISPAMLKAGKAGGYIDPLAQVKDIQQQTENTAMLQQVDPRLMGLLQQRATPEQAQGLQKAQAARTQQFDNDIGALSRVLSGEAFSGNPESSSEYYSYGAEDPIDQILGSSRDYKDGGYVKPLESGEMALPLLVKEGGALSSREDFKDGKHVAGEGDGQSDDIPAWLADGEFVFPADVVSALGNGSTKAGTDKLYEMMHSIRDRARSKGAKDLPPPALKSPLDYLKSNKRSK
jgi:hypothetical protein